MDVFKDLLSTVLVYGMENVKYSKDEHLSVEFSMFLLENARLCQPRNKEAWEIEWKIKPKKINRHNTLNMHSVCAYHCLFPRQRKTFVGWYVHFRLLDKTQAYLQKEDTLEIWQENRHLEIAFFLCTIFQIW